MKWINKKELDTALKEFHTLWEKMGKPHPNSNAYLALTRAFFYTKGLERGIEYSAEMSKENETL